jgi:polynucleotide 5'-hydroxyl-kinase GRC3/NOL9
VNTFDTVVGPPFTHPRQPFKAHFVGSTTIRSFPRHYQECITDLLDAYRLDIKYNYEVNDDRASLDGSFDVDDLKGIPLVINNFGWNKGLGAESIHLIESQVDITHVYAFESNLPDGTGATGVEDNSHAINYFYLEPIKLAKPDHGQADRRSLMIMSYFHHLKGTNNIIQWNTEFPLCVRPPWEVTWADAIDRIILMGSGSEDVVASEVLRVLNGAVVALVALEPSAPRWLHEQASTKAVPYTQGAMPPPPNCSKCVGFALVRGVRASSGSLHILTPVPPELLAQARVLVMGEVKLPIWGMMDFRADAKATNQIAGVKESAVPFLQWSVAPDETPGAKRLRVRRNLMRKNQSFSHP